MENQSWTNVILTGIIPGGQLYARYKYYNLTFDKIYLIPVTLIPPISVIFHILLKLKILKLNQGSGMPSNPFTWWLSVPVLTIILLPYLVKNISSPFDTMITALVTCIAVSIPTLMFLKNNKCKDTPLTSTHVGQSLVSGITAYGFGTMFGLIIGGVSALGKAAVSSAMAGVTGDTGNDVDLLSNTTTAAFFVLSYMAIMIFRQIGVNLCDSVFGTKMDVLLLVIALFAIGGQYALNRGKKALTNVVAKGASKVQDAVSDMIDEDDLDDLDDVSDTVSNMSSNISKAKNTFKSMKRILR